jgi:ABC-type phosphate transport system ATPase subunit
MFAELAQRERVWEVNDCQSSRKASSNLRVRNLAYTPAQLRFYDPISGRVRYGHEDIREITPESWRERISIVPQEPALFSGTIAENSECERGADRTWVTDSLL